MSYNSDMKKIVDEFRKTDYIRPEDLPNIDLYMDQVITFMDRHLETTRRFSSDKLLTKTMINNYTKNDLLPSPEKKKYTKDHLFLLIYIYYMKNFLSINDIQTMLKPLTEKYFGGKGDRTLEDIYKDVFDMQHEYSVEMVRDVLERFTAAENKTKNIEDKEERDLLKRFYLISALCFDVYEKKQLIEAILDDSSMSVKEAGKNKKNDAKKKK